VMDRSDRDDGDLSGYDDGGNKAGGEEESR
jgi:hypothetical protein